MITIGSDRRSLQSLLKAALTQSTAGEAGLEIRNDPISHG